MVKKIRITATYEFEVDRNLYPPEYTDEQVLECEKENPEEILMYRLNQMDAEIKVEYV